MKSQSKFWSIVSFVLLVAFLIQLAFRNWELAAINLLAAVTSFYAALETNK